MAVFAGAERRLWHSIATVTAVNLAANAVAVTLWGATGAAWVMVLSEATGLVMYWRLYRTRMPSPLGRRYPFQCSWPRPGSAPAAGSHTSELGLGAGLASRVVPRAAALVALYLAILALVARIARLASHRWDGRRLAIGGCARSHID